LLLADDTGRAETLGGLKQISQAAHRASNLTRQLLMFSRQQLVQMQPMDLNQALQNLHAMLSRLLGEEISLEFHGRPGLPLIEADQGMIEQVVVNLSTNARDAMPNGGLLTISTDLVDLGPASVLAHSEARAGQFVTLIVSDTGCGMDANTRQHLFEPFFTTKEVGKGTGLGLATVYAIVKQHGGWIEVSSSIGDGSAFRVYLPIAGASTAEPARAAPAPRLRQGHETILLVEDEQSIRDMLGVCLRRLGYQVLMAANGTEALAVWQQQKADVQLLLTDMRMPGGMSGRKLGQRLRSEKSDLRVIISSGYSEEFPEHSVDPTITFLPKPYRMETLAEAVRKALDGAA
jgi:CheY-like chemotaxis protein